MKLVLPRLKSLGALALILSALVQAQEPERKVPVDPKNNEVKIDPAEKPKVEKIGDTRFRMGKIEFDSKTKEIFLPAVVNKREGGPVEYLLVHENGKVHESVVTTNASPLHLQIITKLLKHKSGYGNVFDPMLAEEEQVGSDEENGQKFDVIAVLTPAEGEEKSREEDLSEWIIDAESMKPPTSEPWTLTGSNVRDGAFMADIEGSIVAIYLDPSAIFNMTRKGSEIDERWGANDKKIPKIGEKLTVVLRPVK